MTNRQSASTGRAYMVGSRVRVKDSASPAPVVATVTGLPAHRMCTTCHCTPTNPDHRGDGSLCCPGPFYNVQYRCDECDHVHHEAYAEHELISEPEIERPATA